MNDAAGSRLLEILSLARESQELLDQAVGHVAKLPPMERVLFREYLLPPRTHLRTAVNTLGRQIGADESPEPPPPSTG